MDQFDPWQVVPIQVFTPYSCLLISTAFVVVSRVGRLGVTGVILAICFYSGVYKMQLKIEPKTCRPAVLNSNLPAY